MAQQQMEAISSVVDGNQFEFLKNQIGTLLVPSINLIETSLAEHKRLMEQHQTNNENAIARQDTTSAQQFSVVNSALAQFNSALAHQAQSWNCSFGI
jgi:hypothetical protein